MKWKWLVVAALLLTSISQVAAAADNNNSEHRSKNAQKALILLGAIGIDNTEVKEFVGSIDSQVKDGYFRLREDRIGDGKLTLHLQIRGDRDMYPPVGGGLKRLELRYTPDDSHFSASARTDRLILEYRFKF